MHRLQRSSSSTRITIEQRVPSDNIKKGPHSIKRTVDPNDLVIKRRFGTKPIFDRADIKVNHSIPSKKNSPPKSYRRTRSSSTSSAESIRYNNGSATKRSRVTKSRSLSRPRNIDKKRTPEKVPYFIDEKREKERLQRKQSYTVKKTTSPPRYRTRGRRKSKSRSRSRSPSYRRHHSSDRRPSSGDRYRSRHRLRSRSRSRSRNRERERDHERERYITIPVPIEVPYPAYIPPVGTYPPIRYPGQPPIRYPYIMGHGLPPPVHYPIRYPMRLPRYPQYTPRGQFRQRNL